MKFIGEWNLENKLWTLDVLIGTEVLLLPGPLRARKQTHIHKHIYEIYICIYISLVTAILSQLHRIHSNHSLFLVIIISFFLILQVTKPRPCEIIQYRMASSDKVRNQTQVFLFVCLFLLQSSSS